jgi:hypothetical protein
MKERGWRLILVFATLVLIISWIACSRAEAQVSSANIYSSFPSDFLTAQTFSVPSTSIYSSSTLSYLQEGQPATFNVHFNYYSGGSYLNQPVTVEASCDAFVGSVNQTLTIGPNENSIFVLTPTIKPEMDGTYVVIIAATVSDGSSGQVAQTQTSVNVWSTPHIEAANLLYTAASLTYGYPYGLSIVYNKYQSPQAKANQTLATIEFASAMISFNNKDWNDTGTHAQNSINLMKAADVAETGSDLTGGTTYLIRLITYPILIIAVLIIIYIIVAVYRKVYPPTNTPKES